MSVLSRRLFGARASLLLVLALGVAWVAPPRASAPVPQKGGNKTIFAALMDADNKPVTDLAKDELGVREDGADRVIVDLKPATQPLDVVLMVDTTKPITTSINELRSALKSFAHIIVAGSPGATIALMDVAAAAVVVGDNKKGPEEFDKLLAKTFADRSGAAVFLEGMVDAAKKLAKSPSPRRAIVIVNLDGIPENSSLQPQQVVQQVILSGASMWAVSYSNETSRRLLISGGAGSAFSTDAALAGAKQGGVGSANTGQNRDVLLNTVPQGTGGFRITIDVSSALEQTLNELAAALVAQYEVTYTRPDGPTPVRLQMGQARPGVKISYPATPVK